MAQKDELKQMLDGLFPDNDDGMITPNIVRQFLTSIINLIPEDAAGDLEGTYPNPVIGAKKITAGKMADGVIPTNLPPSGDAGGDLAGLYPNPIIGTQSVIPRMMTKSMAPCRIAPYSSRMTVIGVQIEVDLHSLLTHTSTKGWESKIIDVLAHSGSVSVDLNCKDIPADLFPDLPALIPILIYARGDFNTGTLRVDGSFDGYTNVWNNFVLPGAGGIIGLQLAKTATGYVLVGVSEGNEL